MSQAQLRIGRVRLTPHAPTLIASFTDRTPAAALRRGRDLGLALLEARVDLFEDRDAKRAIACIAKASKILPVLLTIRSASEGGAYPDGEAERLALYRALIPHASAVDVELDASIRDQVRIAARRAKKLVVLSHHDFRKTPSDAGLDQVVRRSSKAGADVTKIAAHVPDDRALGRLARLFSRHPDAPLVVIGMGDHGRKTRVFFPALGSLFTFAALEKTAPGQLGLAQMAREIARYYPGFSSR
jgi:3-dehydroquinate dehydratase-1